MGVLHLAGLGRSPGAVTCGLGYLQQQHGSRTNEQGKIVDEVVVFTSPEVASGELLSQGEVVLNHYGKTSALRSWSSAPVLDVLAECFKVRFPAAALHVCTVDLNDFNDALRVVAQTLHRFHPPGSVGRHVQINLTGGVNVLNSALFQAANLSGLVAKFYYTFAPRENLKYLLPAAEDNPSAFRYQEVPVLTTRAQLDELLQNLLMVLSELQDGAWLDSEELRSLLARGLGEAPDKQDFERDYLNVLDGQFLRRKGERGSDGRNRNTEVQLTAHGRQLLSVMESPWFRALHRDEKLQTVSKEELTQGLLLQQVWPKVK